MPQTRHQRREGMRKGRTRPDQLSDPMLPRKASRVNSFGARTKTDTGRQGEYPKVLETTLVKELGKLTP